MNFPYNIMKYIAGAAAVVAVAPAHATGGFSCSTIGEREIAIGMTLGRTPVLQPIGFVIIIDGERHNDSEGDPRMDLAQTWFDDDHAMLDVVEPETRELLLSLRTSPTEISGVNEGTLTYQGVDYDVRCEFE